MSGDNSILVGCLGSVAWIRIEGSANHVNADSIRQFMNGRFDEGWRRFVVDLEDCKGIDSTFIGMLYRLASTIDEEGGDGWVEIINPSERNERSIRKLGLDTLIRIDSAGDRWGAEKKLVQENLSKPNTCPDVSRQDHAQMVLEAHEALAAANEENQRRFCDVLEFLRQDLEEEKARS